MKDVNAKITALCDRYSFQINLNKKVYDMGMVDGFLSLLPTAHCGHIGLYRNEVTHQPVEYYCKLPAGLADMNVYLLDPMLATGGSGIDAVKILKKHEDSTSTRSQLPSIASIKIFGKEVLPVPDIP